MGRLLVSGIDTDANFEWGTLLVRGNQGSLLFEDTKNGEELSDLVRIPTQCLGDICRADGTEEADCRISNGGHDFGTRPLSDPACVLPERDVAHVVGPIFD
jgi:hypothetical protein